MPVNTFEAVIKECDTLIKTGRPQLVSKQLAALNLHRIPRQWLQPLAQICRRAGLNPLGLKLLSPVVRPKDISSLTATPSELAEYAALLLRTGAISEAEFLLAKIDSQIAPEAMLFRAFANFTHFEFREAISNLESYLISPLDRYSLLVGKVNLAFAQVSCELRGASQTLSEAIAEAKEEGYFRLESNCLALRAQSHIQQGEYLKAETDLARSLDLLNLAQTHDSQFVIKWRAFLESYRTGTTTAINDYRKTAEANEDWDGMRECDLHYLKIKFEKVRFNHLLFGTPFPAYREQITSALNFRPDQNTYILGSKKSPRFDLLTCDFKGSPLSNPGGKCHQLLDVVLHDFYRPIGIGGIYSALFPNENFDAFASPDRVHQLLRRTRLWLKESGVPVMIQEAKGKYSLRLDGDVAFKIPLEHQPVDFMNLQFETLKNAREKRAGKHLPFSAREIREQLGLARTSIQRLLNWGICHGKIEKVGVKNATLYRISAATVSNRDKVPRAS
jgi:hypothetical protein